MSETSVQKPSKNQDLDRFVRILMIEDNVELAEQCKEEITAYFEESDWLVRLVFETNFSLAMERILSTTFDILILDIRDSIGGDEGAGQKVLSEVQRRIFVPVIFHTAYPQHVQGYQSALVRVVAKGAPSSDPKLPEVVEDVLRESLPQMKRALREHVDDVLRTYMWGIVKGSEGEELIKDPPLLAHVLARQIVHSLDLSMLPKLFNRMGVSEQIAEGKIHPVQMYVYPPLDKSVRGAGDIVNIESPVDMAGCWMVLTARCDLVDKGNQKPRVNRVVLARVRPLNEHPKAKETKEKVRQQFVEDSKRMVESREQYYVLPPIATVLPYSYVDFGEIMSVSLDIIRDVIVIACLDDPFAAEMLFRHQRFYGRFGTADLDQDILRRFIDNTKTT